MGSDGDALYAALGFAASLALLVLFAVSWRRLHHYRDDRAVTEFLIGLAAGAVGISYAVAAFTLLDVAFHGQPAVQAANAAARTVVILVAAILVYRCRRRKDP